MRPNARRIIREAVTAMVAPPARDRHRHRERRRDEQDQLRHLHQGPPLRLRRRQRRAACIAISPTSRSSASKIARAHRRRTAIAASCVRRARSTSATARRSTTTSRTSRAALTDAGGSRGLHERGLARRRHELPAQRLLSDHEAYVEAVAEAMRAEYEAIVARRASLLQLDCPDLAMARHTGFQDLSEAEFLRARRAPRRGAQPRAAQHARRRDAHARLLGQLRRPARPRHRRSQASCRIVLKAKPGASLFEAANPRHAHEWEVWRDVQAPRRQGADPGRASIRPRTTSSTPSSSRSASCASPTSSGRERVIAGTDCGFGTFAGFGKIDPDIAYHKLACAGRRRRARLAAPVALRKSGSEPYLRKLCVAGNRALTPIF